GANIDEKVTVSANGQRVRFTRDFGSIVMDLDGVEGIDFNARGGADTVTVDDLTGTDVTALNLALGNPPGSGTGDGEADSVIVNGTNNNDHVDVTGSGSSVTVAGLHATVNVSGSEGDKDVLVVNALGGDDVVDASTLLDNVIQLTLDGGAGNDTLLGSQGAD